MRSRCLWVRLSPGENQHECRSLRRASFVGDRGWVACLSRVPSQGRMKFVPRLIFIYARAAFRAARGRPSNLWWGAIPSCALSWRTAITLPGTAALPDPYELAESRLLERQPSNKVLLADGDRVDSRRPPPCSLVAGAVPQRWTSETLRPELRSYQLRLSSLVAAPSCTIRLPDGSSG